MVKTFSNETAYAVLAEVYNKLSEKYDDGLTVGVGFEDNNYNCLVKIIRRTAKGDITATIFYDKRKGEFYQAILHRSDYCRPNEAKDVKHLDMTGIDPHAIGIDFLAGGLTILLGRDYEAYLNAVKVA